MELGATAAMRGSSWGSGLPLPMAPTHTTPSPASDDDSDGLPAAEQGRSRDRRLVVLVEAFLRQVRRGGSLDPEPFLRSAEELRTELEPLLLGVLRLEQISEGFDRPPRRLAGDSNRARSGDSEGASTPIPPLE